MKKIITIILCFCFLFNLCACGGNTEEVKVKENYVYKDTPVTAKPNNPTVMGLFYRNVVGTTIESDDPTIKAVDEKADAMLKKIEEYPDTLKAKEGCNTYYISAEGDDINDGLSPETPWKTYNNIKTKLKAGDALLFRRGDIFRGKIEMVSGVCLGAYGEGVKPRIYGSHDGLEGEWVPTAEDPDIYEYHGIGGDYANIIFNSGEFIGRPVDSRDRLKKRPLNVFIGQYITVYSPEGNPGEIFHNIEIANSYCLMTGSGGGLKDVTVQNLCLMYTGIHHFGALGPVENMVIEGCVMGFCGGKDLHLPNVVSLGNAVEFWSQAVNIDIHDNYIFQSYDAALTHQGPTKVATEGQTANTDYTNIKYRDNLLEYNTYDIEAFSCRSIKEQSNNPDGTFTYNDVYVTGNICRYTGFGWGSLDRPDKNVCRNFKYDAKGEQNAEGEWTNRHIKPLTIENNIFDRSRKTVLGISSPEDNKANMILKNNQFIEQARISVFGKSGITDAALEENLKKYFGVCEGNVFVEVK